MTLPTDFLSTLTRLDSQATKGPWRWEGGALTYEGPYGPGHIFPDEPELSMDEDGKLVVFLRNHAEAIALLVEEVQREHQEGFEASHGEHTCSTCEALAALEKP